MTPSQLVVTALPAVSIFRKIYPACIPDQFILPELTYLVLHSCNLRAQYHYLSISLPVESKNFSSYPILLSAEQVDRTFYPVGYLCDPVIIYTLQFVSKTKIYAGCFLDEIHLRIVGTPQFPTAILSVPLRICVSS
jgi:hypothetical protein